MSTAISVSASTWTPISAYYPYDDNIRIRSSTIRWADGYTGYEQPLFSKSVDISINRNSIFYLPSSKDLFSFIQETALEQAYQGAYIVLSMNSTYLSPSTQYVTVVDDSLYMNPISGDSSFFRLIPNDDGSCSLLQGNGLYVTVEETTPFNLVMEPLLSIDDRDRQKFYYIEKDNTIYFTTKILNPATFGSTYEERFWSFSKAGPEKGRVRANGLTMRGDYGNAKYQNDYLFNVNNFAVFFTPSGLQTDHWWVRYYNLISDKRNNKNTELNINSSASGVFINHLIDLPYNSKINIDTRGMAVNFANLKNVMTGEYEYRTRK